MDSSQKKHAAALAQKLRGASSFDFAFIRDQVKYVSAPQAELSSAGVAIEQLLAIVERQAEEIESQAQALSGAMQDRAQLQNQLYALKLLATEMLQVLQPNTVGEAIP